MRDASGNVRVATSSPSCLLKSRWQYHLDTHCAVHFCVQRDRIPRLLIISQLQPSIHLNTVLAQCPNSCMFTALLTVGFTFGLLNFARLQLTFYETLSSRLAAVQQEMLANKGPE